MALTAREERYNEAVARSAILLDRVLRALPQGDAEAVRACVGRGLLRLVGLLDEPALANTLRYWPGNAAMARSRFGAAKTKLRRAGAYADPRMGAVLETVGDLLSARIDDANRLMVAATVTEDLGSLPRLDALHAMATACVDPVVCAEWGYFDGPRVVELLAMIEELTGDARPRQDAEDALADAGMGSADVAWQPIRSAETIRAVVACPVPSEYLAAIAEGIR